MSEDVLRNAEGEGVGDGSFTNPTFFDWLFAIRPFLNLKSLVSSAGTFLMLVTFVISSMYGANFPIEGKMWLGLLAGTFLIMDYKAYRIYLKE